MSEAITSHPPSLDELIATPDIVGGALMYGIVTGYHQMVPGGNPVEHENFARTARQFHEGSFRIGKRLGNAMMLATYGVYAGLYFYGSHFLAERFL